MLFNGCESLSSIYCKATVPPYIDMSTFSFMKSEPKIYVPKQSLSAYKTAYNWDRYTNMLEGYDF